MILKDRTDSIWESFELPSYGRVTENLRTDICVVGGGITGISIAYELGRRGHKVLLVEAFRLGSGQTSRTTAHLTCQLEDAFQELLKVHDKKTVSLFYEAHRKAIDLIEDNVKREKIDCDFKRVSGYYFCGENKGEENLKEEKTLALSCGADLEFCKVTPLLNENVCSLRFKDQAQFHPLKYISGLLESMKKFDVTIFEGTHIQSMLQEDRETWTLLTDGSFEIKSHILVVATNTPVNNRFHIHTRQFPYRTYAVSFSLENPIKENCLLWDTEDPYHYIRLADNEMIVGGEDHRVGVTPGEDPFLRIESWARGKFTFLKDVIHKWSGQIYGSVDSIGFIGLNPGLEKNVFISTGGAGIGMTSSAIASQIISDLIEKKDNTWAGIFDPTRITTKGLKRLIKENFSTFGHYADWLRPSEIDQLEDISLYEGGVKREWLMKTCYYHDEGHFERKSAVCTHLGGIVHWNDIEKTWDCPCHGSRFNTKGKVIEGPAISDLMERE